MWAWVQWMRWEWCAWFGHAQPWNCPATCTEPSDRCGLLCPRCGERCHP